MESPNGSPGLPSGVSFSCVQLGVVILGVIGALCVPMVEIRLVVGGILVAGFLLCLFVRPHLSDVVGQLRRMEQLVNENVALQDMVSNQKSSFLSLESQVCVEREAVAAKLAGLQDENLVCRQKLSEEAERYTAVEAANRKSQQQLRAIKQVYDQQVAVSQRAQSELDEIRLGYQAQVGELERSRDEVTSRLVVCEREMEQYQRLVSDVPRLERQVSEINEHLEHLQMTNRELNQENHRLQILLDASLSVESSASHKERARADELEQNLAQLRSQVDQQIAEYQRADQLRSLDYDRVLNEYQDQLVCVRAELGDLQQTYTSEMSQSSNRIADLQTSLQCATDQGVALREEISLLRNQCVSDQEAMAENMEAMHGLLTERIDLLSAIAARQIERIQVLSQLLQASKEYAKQQDEEWLHRSHLESALLADAYERIRLLEQDLEFVTRPSQVVANQTALVCVAPSLMLDSAQYPTDHVDNSVGHQQSEEQSSSVCADEHGPGHDYSHVPQPCEGVLSCECNHPGSLVSNSIVCDNVLDSQDVGDNLPSLEPCVSGASAS
ncbi:MAG: hypothetical protein U0840_00640 [Gemmataceae bacterium]